MLADVYRERPEFWFELSVWDGNFSRGDAKGYDKSKRLKYERAGQTYTPARYGGFVRYGMWLTTPRVVREFRNYMMPRAEYGDYYLELVRAVDEVWTQPELTGFWRKSTIVPNRSRQHPYRIAIPDKWINVDRWYLLSTSLDPAEPWEMNTQIPVFSLARVIGEEGSREWLV